MTGAELWGTVWLSEGGRKYHTRIGHFSACAAVEPWRWALGRPLWAIPDELLCKRCFPRHKDDPKLKEAEL